jgi:hypothetical protein
MTVKNVEMQMDKPNEQPTDSTFTYSQLVGEIKIKIAMKLKAHMINILKYFIKDNTTTQHIIEFNKQIINIDDIVDEYMNCLALYTQINDVSE